MKRREFMITLGASAMAMRASAKKSQPIMQTSESAEAIYKRSYTIDAMCFGAAAQCEF